MDHTKKVIREFDRMEQERKMEHSDEVIREIEPMIPVLKEMIREYESNKWSAMNRSQL